jgi:Holliday junction resolvase RusA-like endonuclease
VTKLQFVVRADPVAMPRPRITVVGGHPHAYTPSKAVEAQRVIEAAARVALADRPRLEGPLKLSVLVYLRPPKSIPRKLVGVAQPTKRPDLSNFIKLVEDACAVLWQDDAQVVELWAAKRYIWSGEPCWHIQVDELPR